MYRKLFIYICKECRKNRQTFKETHDLICRKCKAIRVPENQMSMFGDKPVNIGG